MRYDDWGVRSPQWAGLRSVSTSVCGVPVHYVRAEPVSAAAPDAPVHLLVPPMTGSASMWIDLVPHLRQLGPVISVDLPGTITGHTGAPYRRGPRADLDARFVSAFVRQLRLESQVVLHGWSMGGLVAALAAGMMPDKTRGVALVAPALPWRRTSPAESLGWQTLGRLAVAAGPPTTRIVLRLAGQRMLDAKRTAIKDAGAVSGGRTGLIGGDPGRVSREQVDLWLDGLEAAREHPERLAGHGHGVRVSHQSHVHHTATDERGARFPAGARTCVVGKGRSAGRLHVAHAARPAAGLDTPTHR